MKAAGILLTTGFLYCTACNQEPEETRRNLALQSDNDVDGATRAVEQQHRRLVSALVGDDSVGAYISVNARVFGLEHAMNAESAQGVHGPPGLGLGTDHGGDYWTLVSLRLDSVSTPTPIIVLFKEVAGMPPGVNSLSEYNGTPLVIHWEQTNDGLRASSLQFYPPSPLADSLTQILRGPQTNPK